MSVPTNATPNLPWQQLDGWDWTVAILVLLPFLAWAWYKGGKRIGLHVLLLCLYAGTAVFSFWYFGGGGRGGDLVAFVPESHYMIHLLETNHPDALRLWTLPPTGLVPQDLVERHSTHLAHLGSVYNVAFLRLMAALYWLCGKTNLAPALLLTMASTTALFATARELMRHIPDIHHRWWLLGMLWPGVVFWGATYHKEAVVIAALGWGTWGLLRFYRGARLPWWQTILIGLLLATAYTVKPYIVLAFGAACLLWLWGHLAHRSSRWGWISFLMVIGVLTLILTTSTFNWSRIHLEIDYLRQVQRATEISMQGRPTSYFDIGLPPTPTTLDLLVHLPEAFVATYLRPFPWGLHTLLLLPFVLGTATLLGLAIWHLRKGIRWQILLERPWVLTFLAFAFGYGIFLGLTVMYAGSLVRYRAPLLPFLWWGLLALQRHHPALPNAHPDRTAPATPPAVL